MPLTKNTVTRFFSWWKQGLMQPWEKALLKANSNPKLLSVVANELVDYQGNALSEADISKLKKGGDVYLLAPGRKVMSIGVSDTQKGLSLSQVVEELLPFDASELFFASDAEQKHIHAIVRSELLPQINVIEAHGLGLSGVAFGDSAEPLLSSRLDQELAVDQPAVQTKLSKLLPISALAISVAFMVTLVFLTHQETKKQALLNDELAQLQQRLDARRAAERGSPAEQRATLAAQIEIRDAAQVMSALTAVANSLTETARLDQIILSKHELVLDASAKSATQVQANLDRSGAFESSEFVTSISRNNSDASERFRLKANVKEGR